MDWRNQHIHKQRRLTCGAPCLCSSELHELSLDAAWSAMQIWEAILCSGTCAEIFHFLCIFVVFWPRLGLLCGDLQCFVSLHILIVPGLSDTVEFSASGRISWRSTAVSGSQLCSTVTSDYKGWYHVNVGRYFHYSFQLLLEIPLFVFLCFTLCFTATGVCILFK